jgi:hypothetical protein
MSSVVVRCQMSRSNHLYLLVHTPFLLLFHRHLYPFKFADNESAIHISSAIQFH